MGGGGGVVGAIVGAVVTVVGVVTGQPQIIAMGVTMMASSIISAVTAPKPPSYAPNETSQQLTLNAGSNVQVPPATNNKLPVVYGTTYVGGTVTDLSITSDNQTLYYVLSICEVTNVNQTTINFGDIYYGGKKVILNGTNVTGLLDTSTGVVNTEIDGLMSIYLYNNGSYHPTNTSRSAINVMQSSGLTYTWDNTKLMSNTVFAIIQLTYNADKNITSLAQTQFQIINSTNNTGDVFYDYLTNDVYGAAIPANQIDTASLTALTAYSNQLITFKNHLGVPSTQPRFKFNGALDTTKSVMTNLQNMTQCCDCLLKYNEIYGKWSVVVQSPTTPVVMHIDNSNTVSAITITTLDISNTYNIAECQFPDITLNSAFNTSTIDLAVVDPTLLYPNEPQNSQTIQLPLVNNDVQAQLLATRYLKAARQDLQIQCTIDFTGLELEAGDIVTVTNANYGWDNKQFRCLRVEQNFASDSGITVSLLLQEYDAAVYNDAAITAYAPAPNSGLPSPVSFGTIPAPVVTGSSPTTATPSISLAVTSSSSGITQYAEVWYSAFPTPTVSQRIFAGTTEIQSDGTPYQPNTVLPTVTLSGIPPGNWYFFSRMVNSLSTSNFSPPSAVFAWKPTTKQYEFKYLMVAYADDAIGTGFSLNPRGKLYYGLCNQDNYAPNSNPAAYTWYLANPTFGTDKYLVYINRTGRLFSYGTSTAGFASGTALFVPSNSNIYDPSAWSALEDGINYIDLDVRTGQLTATGTTTVGTGEIAVLNNPDGTIVAALQQYLNFGGAYTKTSSAATITVDIYGRVVGFEPPDNFDYTPEFYIASSNQTVFSVTRGSGYIVGQCWVFQNGSKLAESEYTDAAHQVTLNVGAHLNDIITIISFKSVNATTGVYVSFSYNTATLTNQTTYTCGFPFVGGTELLFLNGTVVNQSDYNVSGNDITFLAGNTSGLLQVIQWTPNNLSVPNGTPVNVSRNSIIGQTTYSFAYDPFAFNLYENGVLLLESTDFTIGSGVYTLANTPTISSNLLQQTFARTGAV